MHSQPSYSACDTISPAVSYHIVCVCVGLAATLGINTAVEMTRQTLGLGGESSNNPLLTQANIESIVSTLCRVRGAALKIGQMISIQGMGIYLYPSC